MSETERERLKELLVALSLQRGEFTLSSGRTSGYYLDCRRTTLHPEGAWLVARIVLDLLEERQLDAQAIGGLTLGADPIVAAVAALSFQQGRPLPGFIVRSEQKAHGTRQRIEGCPVGGKRAVVVDDVVTTGGSTLEAIRAVMDAGGTVCGAICVVDREEGGAKALAGVPFHPVFKWSDLLGG